jgi:hypothetical protein
VHIYILMKYVLQIAAELRVYAKVVSVRLLLDPRSGAPRGCAAVEFSSAEHAAHTVTTAAAAAESGKSSAKLLIDDMAPALAYARVWHPNSSSSSSSSSAQQQYYTAAAVEAAAAALLEAEARSSGLSRRGLDDRGGSGSLLRPNSNGVLPAIYAAALAAAAAAKAAPAAADAGKLACCTLQRTTRKRFATFDWHISVVIHTSMFAY